MKTGSARASAYYSRQWYHLRVAFRRAGHPRPGDATSAFFREFHGYKRHAETWARFTDRWLLRLAAALIASTERDRPWRAQWSSVLSEVNRRGLLTCTSDDLMVAWDACAASGEITSDELPTLVDVWLRYKLSAGRGEI